MFPDIKIGTEMGQIMFAAACGEAFGRPDHDKKGAIVSPPGQHTKEGSAVLSFSEKPAGKTDQCSGKGDHYRPCNAGYSGTCRTVAVRKGIIRQK